MQLKDYYSILEISPQAGADAIRKAYRRLAKLYHPDKTGNDPDAALRFKEVQEAYETLINPKRKNEYLRERWYQQATAQPFAARGADSAPAILLECLEANRRMSRADSFRMDRIGTAQNLTSLLSDDRISRLKDYGDPLLQKQVVLTLLDCCRLLPDPYFEPVTRQLKKLVAGNVEMEQRIAQFEQTARRKKLWESWKTVLALVLALFICWLMFRISHSTA